MGSAVSSSSLLQGGFTGREFHPPTLLWSPSVPSTSTVLWEGCHDSQDKREARLPIEAMLLAREQDQGVDAEDHGAPDSTQPFCLLPHLIWWLCAFLTTQDKPAFLRSVP